MAIRERVGEIGSSRYRANQNALYSDKLWK